MIEKVIQRTLLILGMVLLMCAESKAGTILGNDDSVIERVRRIVEEIKIASYPELANLKNAEIEIKLFDSPSDYFQTRFTFTSFLFKKRLRYMLRVNRNLFASNAPDDGVRAIIAHELGHVVYYKARNRIQLLGLARLACKGFTARFERATDLRAISRGYSDGLKSYRLWLYRQIPAKNVMEKRRNYFSPAEIDALNLKLRAQPKLMEKWLKAPPNSLEKIEGTSVSQQLQATHPTIIFSLQ